MNSQTDTVTRILDNLENENVEPTLILWAITHELRSLINISFAIKQGMNIEQAMTQNNVWYNRKQQVKKALRQNSLDKLQKLLKNSIDVELIIKGADRQKLLRHELKKIYLALAGQ